MPRPGRPDGDHALVPRPKHRPLTILTLAGGGLVKDSTSKYHSDMATAGQASRWVYEWFSTGAIADQVGEFEIDPRPLH